MSFGFITVKAHSPCPICGKPDWCGWLPTEYGKKLYCKRDGVKKNQVGLDGANYIYRYDSRSGYSVYEEYTQYCARKGERSNGDQKPKFEKASVQWSIAPTPLNIIEPKPAAELDPIYRYLQSQLRLEDIHRNYLHNQGWSDEMIEHFNVVSFPERDALRDTYNRKGINPHRRELAARIIKKFGPDSLTGVPGAYKLNGNWTFNGPSGLLFPMYDLSGNLYRLRIRMDFRDVEGRIYSGFGGTDDYTIKGKERYQICMKGLYRLEGTNKIFAETRGKYRTLSSYHEDKKELEKGFLKNTFDCGCGSNNEISCYTDKSYPNFYWLVTEGEPKGAFTSMKLKTPVITLPGVGSYRLILEDGILEALKEKGMRGIIVAFDADKHTNENVLRMESMLIEGLKEKGVTQILKAEWDGNVGKGIDDNLAAGGSLRFVPA